MKESIGGPFLQMAVFCEKVLEEKTGTLSAIRIIDRFTISTIAPSAPDIMPAVNIGIHILVCFKSGDFKGKQKVEIKPFTPSGKELPGWASDILLEGDERGANIILEYGFAATEEGVYWFDVILAGNVVTKMPLRLIYDRTQVTTGSAQSAH